MKEAHLVLNLTLHKQDGTSEDIILELSKDELDHFINTLERAQKVTNNDFLFLIKILISEWFYRLLMF